MARLVKAADGRTLAVESAGDPDGKPVFLFHGTPGGRNGPRPRGIVLYRLGIRLISYDRPGYSGSTRQPGRIVRDAASDVADIAEALGIDRFSVIGRSGGGPHALACAAILKDQVECAAALGSLAPCDAEGLGWWNGMADSNVRAYQAAEDILEQRAAELTAKIRSDPESLLRSLGPELVSHDKKVVGDIALRRLIAETHAEALKKTPVGWIDDVLALRSPWGFPVDDIRVPVMLWHGTDDVFSPVSHTHWLAKQIAGCTLRERPGAAHFGTVESLPSILNWITDTAGGVPRKQPIGAISVR